jgi:hypothetical protein
MKQNTKDELVEKKVYDKLKNNLLEVGYLNNNLIYAAKLLKQANEKDYVTKIKDIHEFLNKKMHEGDGVAYALVYAANEETFSKNEALKSFKEINKFLFSHTDLCSLDGNEFFDPKVVYFAEVLGDDYEV